MAKFQVVYKNRVETDKKNRVYFTCHPDDFEKYFKKLCDDIFKTHDCAIFYTPDLTEVIPETEQELELGRHNLFVVPVTFRLLTTANRAMDADIPYALRAHIPVLPIMMEPGIDGFYAAPDKFGQLQYLNPYSTDLTEIPYGEKLKKFLDSVLISSEMAERIRAAFDAYIFLSYRKKDRKYANTLMRLIHENPEYRDIAIWFDEFLTPGENFKTHIEKILDDCKLFTLLVTPRLLETVVDENGEVRQNYVLSTELPLARRKHMEKGTQILAVEMEATDRQSLRDIHIEDCVDPNGEAFRTRLLDSLTRMAITTNNTPEHNFLIGLAYMEGIDVEVNRERGMELITGAAEDGLFEACCRLSRMYGDGIGIALDYRQALHWAEKTYEQACTLFGDKDPQTLMALNNLAFYHQELGNYAKALELNEKVYRLRCQVLGNKHPDTLMSLSHMATNYGKQGDYKKELELAQKVYDLQCKTLDKKHPDILISMTNLALAYENLGNTKKAVELGEKSYRLHCSIRGERDINTLRTLSNLAGAYGKDGDYAKELELREKLYPQDVELLGEEHPDTLISLSNLALAYWHMKQYEKSVELNEKAYRLRCKVLGEGHPYTLLSLDNLSAAYGEAGDYAQALQLAKKAYTQYCRILEKDDPDTLMALNNLAYAYRDAGDHRKALELQEKAYPLFDKVFGRTHPNTLTALSNLVQTYLICGEFQKAMEMQQLLNQLRKQK